MGKQRKKTLQELMQERATGTDNQSAYTTEPRKIRTESVKSQVDRLYQRKQPQSFSDKVVDRYNQIRNSSLGFVTRSFGTGVKTGLAGIGQSIFTDFASNLQKGEEKSIGKNIIELASTISNPKGAMIKGIAETAKETGEILKDKDKSVAEKLSQTMTNTASGVSNTLLPRKTNN